MLVKQIIFIYRGSLPEIFNVINERAKDNGIDPKFCTNQDNWRQEGKDFFSRWYEHGNKKIVIIACYPVEYEKRREEMNLLTINPAPAFNQ